MLLLVFACTLVVAILFSARAERTVLSASVLFLVVGAFLGEDSLGLLTLDPADPLISTLSRLALFIVLFTDGMKLSVRDLRQSFLLPGRALIFGLPLTIAGTALCAHFLAGLPWTESVLTGAILSPTDPVLVSAIVGREDIPQGLRHLLNIESGLNDGLALPVVIVTLRMIAGQKLSIGGLLLELALGVAVGIAVPSLVIALERLPFFAVTDSFKPLMAAGIGILVYSMCSVLDANAFLGAFFAGITVASLGGDLSSASHELGESVSEIVKLAALLVFGALLSLRFLGDISLGGFGFAVAALLLVRPLALLIALIGNSLPRHQFWAAAWFGPKGFASVTYALLALRSGIERSDAVFHLAALVTAASIIAHSSTDVPVARWIVRHEAK